MGAEHTDRFAGLNQQRLVVVERLQSRDNCVEIGPGACRAADAAVDNQLMRIFSNVRVQIVHQHAHRCFGQPALGGDLGASRREDVAHIVAGILHRIDLRLEKGVEGQKMTPGSQVAIAGMSQTIRMPTICSRMNGATPA